MEAKSEFIPRVGYGVDLDTQIYRDAEKLAQAVRDGITTRQHIKDHEVPHDVLYEQIGISEHHSGFSFGSVSTFALVMLAVGSPCPFCGKVIESFEHAYKEFPIRVDDENFSLAHRECYGKGTSDHENAIPDFSNKTERRHFQSDANKLADAVKRRIVPELILYSANSISETLANEIGLSRPYDDMGFALLAAEAKVILNNQNGVAPDHK